MNPARWMLSALLLTSAASAGGAGGPGTPVRSASADCLPGFVQPSADALGRQLNAARARWAASGIRAYSFDFDQIAQPVRFAKTRITVLAGGRLNAVTPDGSPASGQALGATMRGLFGAVQDSIAFARETPCAELRVVYARDGHLIQFSLERRDINIADGGASWTVSRFRRLN